MAKKAQHKERRGGLRSPRGGRPTRYQNKLKMPQSYTLTQEAVDAITAAAERTDASESDVVTHLAVTHAADVQEKDLPPKATMKG
jgi:hypothetical protein